MRVEIRVFNSSEELNEVIRALVHRKNSNQFLHFKKNPTRTQKTAIKNENEQQQKTIIIRNQWDFCQNLFDSDMYAEQYSKPVNKYYSDKSW